MCKKIDHFPEDADYEADAAEYLLRKSDMNTSMMCLCSCSPVVKKISQESQIILLGHVTMAKQEAQNNLGKKRTVLK